MSNSKGGRPGTYLVCAEGVTQACIAHMSDTQAKAVQLPEAYTWKDLKDLVRPQTEHDFWADMKSLPNGSGQRVGCVRTSRRNEAGNVYSMILYQPSRCSLI